MSRRALTSAIGVVALLSASYFPMTSACAATGETAIIVPYPPGGPLDVSARALADAVKDKLGTTIVENRPGAGGNVGMSTAKRRDGDGKTLVMGAVATLAINPHLYPTLPYDPKKDFKSVTLVATAPNVVVITPAFAEKNNIKNLQDLVAYAKANPGKLNFASGGNGSAGHLAAALLQKRCGIEMTHIPFNGAAQGLLSVLAGQTDLIIDNLASAAGNIRGGKLIALAVTTKARTPLMPEIPTVEESGIPDFDIYTWFGLQVPASTPDDVVQKLHDAFAPALATEEMKKRFEGFGATPAPMTPAEFDKLIADEYAKYDELVEISGAKVD
ncbi:MAG: tripartite tricarboxylate transporter substrate binding protein [Sutterella parvirubra]|nr:tripartite tricarboxylate transporter substrate binding protein [Sutterella parvirubra]MCI7709211.1 tripartite tricarboxylate transporter substrate binding protein [Sutterella parvirubra]MDR3769846.1 tripartite tricarboxylate transporter substrate binding protein [Sutterella sp.]